MKALALVSVLLAGALAGVCVAQQPADGTAPAVFDVEFRTTSGNFTLEVHRDWAPHEADRFYTLVKLGYYTGNAFFRVIRGFVAQWGLSPDPRMSAMWERRPIVDDPAKVSNQTGTVSFAASGPHTRTTQVFVNLADNRRLDKAGFAPFARVASGWPTVEELESGYGGLPQQKLILRQGAAYLTREFPRLDVIYSAAVLPPTPPS